MAWRVHFRQAGHNIAPACVHQSYLHYGYQPCIIERGYEARYRDEQSNRYQPLPQHDEVYAPYQVGHIDKSYQSIKRDVEHNGRND